MICTGKQIPSQKVIGICDGEEVVEYIEMLRADIDSVVSVYSPKRIVHEREEDERGFLAPQRELSVEMRGRTRSREP